MKILTFLATCLMVLSFSFGSSGAVRSCTTVLWDGPHFAGHSISLPQTGQIVNLVHYGWDNRVESFRSTCSVEFFTGVNAGGEWVNRTHQQEVGWLGKYRDTISSFYAFS